MEYKIIYIDEEESEADKFKDFVESKDSASLFGVEHLYPKASLDEMIEAIMSEGPDAVISDYRLNENIVEVGFNVPYTGVKLIGEFLSRRQDFPCFVMTSYPSDAANLSEDVNLVYYKNKSLSLNDNKPQDKASADINFLERVKVQIDHYRTRVTQAENRVLELIAAKNDRILVVEEEAELIRLDSLLEGVLDRRSSVPEGLKVLSNEQKLNDLLARVDNVLQELGRVE